MIKRIQILNIRGGEGGSKCNTSTADLGREDAACSETAYPEESE